MSKTNYYHYLTKRKPSGFLYRFTFVYPFFLKYLGRNNLDYGCGIGDFLYFCKILKKQICGCDINQDLVEDRKSVV